MRVRTLTPVGIAKFIEYLDLLEAEPTRMAPTHLLEGDEFSQAYGNPTEIERKSFETRYAAAEYLDDILAKTGVADPGRNVGLGTWLTLLFFDQLCPPNKSGERELRERPAYIPEPQNFRRYYRH